ncbi:nuclear transport factor 2 family protein [Roseateles oligotrophus]|uniref:Nuclear transport factor 2 family protein n=1 Tax=Roseateles oligotrophus TaxID=1769250 RepID=A0ABT2YIJ6_9BURK|nr:nuclear transport factor 2 family protein [Roseateles oligotrophus]MCV2369745.1 nuclear transport factor 2 family protein [Roseateles oligotrophus]
MLDTLKLWHHIVDSADAQALGELLADDVVFHSPVVHKPQQGKALTGMYLAGALQVLLKPGKFRYLREIVGPRDAMLEFIAEVDGIEINGVDIIRWDETGRICDFKVMIRPLKAINLLQQKMAEMLQLMASKG